MIKLSLITLLCIFFSTSLLAQKHFKPVVSASANYATHGTGDMLGMLFNFGITQSLIPRLSVRYELGFSLHGSDDKYIFDQMPPSGVPVDAPYWTTASIQVSPRLQFNATGKGFTGFKIGVAPVLRYQLNSNPLSYSINSPGTPYPRPTYIVIYETDRNHLNIGYSISLQYDFRIARRSSLGVGASFQNDTNGDAITALGLTYSHLFK